MGAINRFAGRSAAFSKAVEREFQALAWEYKWDIIAFVLGFAAGYVLGGFF